MLRKDKVKSGVADYYILRTIYIYIIRKTVWKMRCLYYYTYIYPKLSWFILSFKQNKRSFYTLYHHRGTGYYGIVHLYFYTTLNVKYLVDTHFKIINTNKNKCELYFEDAKAYSEMLQLLMEKQISSYSYTAEDVNHKSLVLRELFYGTDIADIKKEIDFLCPVTIDYVTKFTTFF